MSTLVKICGIRNPEAALAAADAGADMIGLNFIADSRRRVSKEVAGDIARAVAGRVAVVGVFRNDAMAAVKEHVLEIPLGYVQLHGEESPEYCQELETTAGIPVIKAFPLDGVFDVGAAIRHLRRYNVKYHLVDRLSQGTGAPLDPASLAQLATRIPIIVAGGLTPQSVGGIVRAVHPAGVDVAGGIETDGVEDPEKIALFVRQAHA
jgi:phosphoribosylanthranilate isomerase